jgi:hypothetical protein
MTLQLGAEKKTTSVEAEQPELPLGELNLDELLDAEELRE